jgi:hypothetical protein
VPTFDFVKVYFLKLNPAVYFLFFRFLRLFLGRRFWHKKKAEPDWLLPFLIYNFVIRLRNSNRLSLFALRFYYTRKTVAVSSCDAD